MVAELGWTGLGWAGLGWAHHQVPMFLLPIRADRVLRQLSPFRATPGRAAAAQVLSGMGFKLIATGGTAKFLEAAGIACEVVKKVYEGRPDVVDMMKDGGIQLVLNTTEGAASVEDSREIRSVALYDKIPYFTTLAGAHAAALAMKERGEGELVVKALQA